MPWLEPRLENDLTVTTVICCPVDIHGGGNPVCCVCVFVFQIAAGGGLRVGGRQRVQGRLQWDYCLEDPVWLTTLQAGHQL